MLPVLSPPYSNQVVYGHQFSGAPQQPQRRALFYPPTPEQLPSQHVAEASSTYPSPGFATQPPYYQQQAQPLPLPNNWPPHHAPQNLPQSFGAFDDISPAFKGKAFIYDCMVRALESLSPDGASVKDIFDHVWLNNRAFILARSRDGDTEASRRASTKNTIVNYLSTSPAFESIGRNRWVLTGKRHGADKRGGKIKRRLPKNPGNEIAAPPSSRSSSSAGNSSSSSSPEISNLSARRDSATFQPSNNGSHDIPLNTSAPSADNASIANRPAATALSLSNGLIQGPTQASSPSTPFVRHTLNPEPRQYQNQTQHHHHHHPPIVSSLPSHAAPLRLQPGISGPTTAIPGDNNAQPQRETFSYGQSAQPSTTTINSTSSAAPPANGGTRRSFDAVPLVLPPRPPRTWHQDFLDSFPPPAQTPVIAPTPKTAPTSLVLPFNGPPSGGRLFQIPSNTSYYESPSITTTAAPSSTSYTHYEEHNPSDISLAPSTLSSSFRPASTFEDFFAPVDPQGGCAGGSIPGVQQQHHQAQHFSDHDSFAAPPAFV